MASPNKDLNSDTDGLSTSFRFLPAGLGDTEDLERYTVGGFHPVHLGDTYDSGRYKICHKLGAGGFSTVWLAQDQAQHNCVALKILQADFSKSTESKAELISSTIRQIACNTANGSLIVEETKFTLEGPNGRHLCLVLPVLGPSASHICRGIESRLRLEVAKKVARGAAKALATLHDLGICHGDFTTANILSHLKCLDQYSEDEIYSIFGPSETTPLETESGYPTGPEAPGYIVKAVDFLSTNVDLIQQTVALTDSDQAFLEASPPKEMLGTPFSNLAPEVAIGHPGGPATDVWALGCSIFRLRSGENLFGGFEVTSPADLMRSIIKVLGEPPESWKKLLFDQEGKVNGNQTTGEPLWTHEQPIPLQNLGAALKMKHVALTRNFSQILAKVSLLKMNERNTLAASLIP